MSLFGSMLREFDDESFYNMHRDEMRRVERMMDNFLNPFEGFFGGGFGFPQLMGTTVGGRERRDQQLFPYGGFGFPDIGSMFAGMQRMANDPNCHSYSSSSVVSYSMGEDGSPTVYQASSSTRTAPGGVKETRKTVCDSTTGYQKMSIGHHIGDRAHIIEKSQNKHTGEQDDSEEFINLDETEASQFNDEWCSMTRQGIRLPVQQKAFPASVAHRTNSPLAITAGPSSSSSTSASGGSSSVSRKRDKDSNRLGSGHPSAEKSRRTIGHKHNKHYGSSRSRHDPTSM